MNHIKEYMKEVVAKFNFKGCQSKVMLNYTGVGMRRWWRAEISCCIYRKCCRKLFVMLRVIAAVESKIKWDKGESFIRASAFEESGCRHKHMRCNKNFYDSLKLLYGCFNGEIYKYFKCMNKTMLGLLLEFYV